MAALFFMFSKIGLFSIGGGYAVIAVIQEQLVIKSGWISQQAFTDMIAISQMTPGPLAINISTFVGMQLSGIPGAVAATLGCVSAGVIISLLLGIFFRKYENSFFVSSVLSGLKATSLGLIFYAGLTILLLTFYGVSDLVDVPWPAIPDFTALALFAAAFFALRKWKPHPILLMLAGGAAGLFLYL